MPSCDGTSARLLLGWEVDHHNRQRGRLVQHPFADYLRDRLGWGSVYAYDAKTFGPQGTLGRASVRDVWCLFGIFARRLLA